MKIIYLFLIFLCFCGTITLKAALKTKQEVIKTFLLPNSFDEILFGVNLKEYTATQDTLVAYIDTVNSNKIYIPLIDFLQIIKFPVKPVNDNPFLLKGYYLEKNNEVTIDLYNKVASSKGLKTLISAGDIVISKNGEVYMSKEFLSILFDISIFIDMPKLIIKIETSNKLQIDVDFEKYKIKENITDRYDQQNFKKDVDLKNYERYDPLFLINNVDIVNKSSFSKQDTSNSNLTNRSNETTIYSGAIILGLDTKFYINNQANYNYGNKKNAGLTFSKPYPYESFYGVKTFIAGDINALNASSIMNSSARRGVYLSSLNDYGINDNQTITITGILQEGWEVELYKYSTLIDFKKNDSGESTFSFTTDLVNYGFNEFALVFIGPFGEIKREVKRFYIGNNPVEKGDIAVKSSFGQNTRKVIEFDSSMKNTNELLATENTAFYGVTDNITTYVGYYRQDDPNITLFNKDIVNNIFNHGYIVSLFGIGNNSSIFYNQTNKKSGFSSSLNGNLGFGNLFANYTYFGKTQTYRSFSGGLFLNQQVELRYSNYIDLKIFALPISTTYRYNEYSKPIKSHDLTVRSSQLLFRKVFVNVENTLTNNINNNNNSIRNKIQLTASSNISGVSLNSRISYFSHPDPQFTDYELSTIYRYNSNISFGATYKHIFQSLLKDSISLNFGYKTPIGSFLLDHTFLNNKNYSIDLSYSVSLAYNSIKRSINISPDTLGNSDGGKLLATIFIDVNQNGVFDKDDLELDNTALLINNSKANSVSYNGQITTAVSSYTKNQINIDEASLGDINLSYIKQERKIIFRPNVARNIAFPISQVALLEGRLYKDKNKTVVLKNYKITLVNSNNKEIATLYTDKDGNFDVNNIPYGKYKIVLIDINETINETDFFVINEEVISRTFYLKDTLQAIPKTTPKGKR